MEAFAIFSHAIGAWHRISAEHMESCLEGMVFRFNRRGSSDLFVDTLQPYGYC